jgi:cytochrome c553
MGEKLQMGNHKYVSVPISLSLAMVALLAISGAVFAEGTGKATASISNGKNIFTNGKEGVPACMSCHGENAMGLDAMGTPRLASVGYAYIVKQLTDFATDKRTDTTMSVMNGFAKALTEQDIRDLAAYENTLEKAGAAPDLSDLKALKAAGTVVGEPYLGKSLVLYGKTVVQNGVTHNVSACSSCHGYDGRGSDPIYPKIGQQKYVYLINQLKKWHEESRTNDPMGQMRAIAKNLTEDDINNAAAYLSQAPANTMGNSFVPDNQTTLENVVITK